MGGDGQVTMGDMVVKGAAKKIRKFAQGKVLAGFAGATADAFTLLERFERRLESRQGMLSRAADDLSRDWRTDRVLRRLEAMLIVADARELLVMSGLGDVLSPERDLAAIGSGAGYAEAAARALAQDENLSAADIVRRSMEIAADMCVYTNTQLTIEEIQTAPPETDPRRSGIVSPTGTIHPRKDRGTEDSKQKTVKKTVRASLQTQNPKPESKP